jgi:hypothetical protein
MTLREIIMELRKAESAYNKAYPRADARSLDIIKNLRQAAIASAEAEGVDKRLYTL